MSNWFYAANGQQQGPFQDAQLRDLIFNGTVRADTLVWTAGVQANPMVRSTDFPLEPRGRVRVLADLRIAGDEGIIENAWAAGVRWDARRWLAVKSDFRAQLSPDLRREHLVRVQLAISF